MSRLSMSVAGDKTMDCYSLRARKGQAILHAAPVSFHRPKRQAERLVYSREHAKLSRRKLTRA